MSSLPNPPSGVRARSWRDDGDWAHIADLNNAYTKSLDIEEWVTANEVKGWLATSQDIDRGTDYVFLEADGAVVGYGVASTYLETGGRRVYRHNGKVLPERTGRGLGSFLLDWLTARHALRCPDQGPGVLQADAYDRDEPLVQMLEARGYVRVAEDAHLVRPHLDALADRSLPPGVETRPVTEDQLRTIYEAEVAAFRDHWGEREATEGDWDAFVQFAHRDESLWKIAWHGGRVVGIVRGYINEEENEAFGLKRGWSEFISTHRDFRGRGIASALIVATLAEFKDRGLEEASLGVHVENQTGAYSLYTGLGFELVNTSRTYERPAC